MESLCVTHSIPPYLHTVGIPICIPPSTRLGAQPRPQRQLVSSKKSDFQENVRSILILLRLWRQFVVKHLFDAIFAFVGDYSKPLRLLPATQVNVITNLWPEKMIESIGEIESESLYRILLRTSPIYGSELTDMSAGILICIISESGDSILQRIPATSHQELLQESEGVVDQDVLHFKRSSTDEFVFQGPKLGVIEAVWISVESGRWRFGGANLTVINGSDLQSGESIGNSSVYTSMRYDFETEDILLGEGGDISMTELRPCRVTEYSFTDISQLLNKDITRSTFPGETKITNKESMQEYADLKLSLLLYDAMLVFSGTSIASFTAGENSALAFLTGGIGGFLYLLLLQRSVDGIKAPRDTNPQRKEDEENTRGVFGGLNSPLLILAFAFGLSILVAKSGSMEVDMLYLSPKEIVVGMIGFLACKLAVILAAFKPLSIGLKDAD
ncbi:hypothetical protein V2J09_001019 [Rumex salicifolius]